MQDLEISGWHGHHFKIDVKINSWFKTVFGLIWILIHKAAFKGCLEFAANVYVTISIKNEYLELVQRLNRSNKSRNQLTALYFHLDSTDPDHLKLFAAVSIHQKLLLCEKKEGGLWVPVETTSLFELVEFLTSLLNKVKDTSNITTLIKSNIFKSE